MLKQGVKIVLSTFITGFLLALSIIIENKIVLENVSDFNKKRIYLRGPAFEIFQYSMLLAAFFFLIHLIVKFFLRNSNNGIYQRGLVTGVIVVAIWFILTNCLAITRPRITDPIYIIDLLTMLGIGCTIPFIEKTIDKAIRKFKNDI